MVQFNLFPGQEQRHRHREGSCGHWDWEGRLEWIRRWGLTYIHLTYISSIKQITSGKLLYSTRSSAQCFVMNLRERRGRETQGRGDISSVQSSRSVVSDSLWPHESQHVRPPSLSPTPGVQQIHVHRVRHAIQPSHPQSSPSPPALNPSQHQSLFQWVNSSHEVAKVLEFQL